MLSAQRKLPRLLADTKQKPILLQVQNGSGGRGLILVAKLTDLGGGHGLSLIKIVQVGNVRAFQIKFCCFLSFEASDTAADGGDQHGKCLKAFFHE